jgi:uncharacterized integral membrane protein (TIGR00697 family)
LIPAMLVSVIYVTAQILSNIASLQIVHFLGLSMDAGTLLYPFTFTLRDLAHKTLGLKGVRALVVASAVLNLFMAVYFWVVSKLPPDTAAGSSEIWGRVLAPVWRITMASIVSALVSELVDTEAYRIWVDRITKRFEWMRVLVSNAISVPTDTFLFCFMAFYGTMPLASVMGIVWANIILKGVVTIISLPMIYMVRERKAEKGNTQ